MQILSGHQLLELIHVDEENLSQRKRFLGIDEQTQAFLASYLGWARECAPELARRFYDHQFSFEPTRSFFEQHAAHKGVSLAGLREVLERTQAQYFIEIFEGATQGWDLSYFARRLRIGATHDKINLPQKWYFASYSDVVRIAQELLQSKEEDPLKREAFSQALFKLINLDQQAVADAFLLSTLVSFGIDVRSIESAQNRDVTDEIAQVKEQLGVIREQAEYYANDQLDAPILQERVGGSLGNAFATMGSRLQLINKALSELAAGLFDSQELSRLNATQRHPGGIQESIINTVRVIEKVVSGLRTLVEAASDGDLSAHFDFEGIQGAYREVGEFVEELVDLFNRVLKEVHGAAGQFQDTAGQISQGSQQLAETTNNQALALEQLVASAQKTGPLHR